MKKTNKKGFTIIELVIVIAVIAILAAVLIPTFSGIIEKANKSAAEQDARNAYTQYVITVADQGEYVDDCWIKTKKGYVEIKDGEMQLKDSYSTTAPKDVTLEDAIPNPADITKDEVKTGFAKVAGLDDIWVAYSVTGTKVAD